MIRADLLTKLAKPITLNDLGLTEHDVPTEVLTSKFKPYRKAII